MVSHFLLEKAVFIKFVGGVFLLFLAYKEIRSKPDVSAVDISANPKLSTLAWETFFLTLASPMTILSFIAIFSTVSGDTASAAQSFSIVIGIFLGSMSWWLALGSIIARIRHRLPQVWMRRLHYVSALILGGFGVWAVFQAGWGS